MPRRYLFASALLLGLAASSCAPRFEAPPKKSLQLSEPAEKLDPKEVQAANGLELLRKRIDAALDHVHRREMAVTDNFWGIFHAILGMGPEATYLVDPETKKKEKAIDIICRGGPIKGMDFQETPEGLDVISWVGTGIGQGHQDQFVSEMVQWGLPPSTPFKVNGKDYRFEDFLRHSTMRASLTRKQELSWAVIIVAQHHGTNYTWKNKFGETLSVEDMVRYEMNEPFEPAACGGTHRLFGITWAYYLHRQNGGQKTGVWKEAAEYLENYKNMARKHRCPDGAFSTQFIFKPENVPDPEQRIRTTGHVLEWLALYLPDNELKSEWMQEAAHALVRNILESKNRGIEGGALYHATHGLHIYRTRVFGPNIPHPPVYLPVPKD